MLKIEYSIIELLVGYDDEVIENDNIYLDWNNQIELKEQLEEVNYQIFKKNKEKEVIYIVNKKYKKDWLESLNSYLN